MISASYYCRLRFVGDIGGELGCGVPGLVISGATLQTGLSLKPLAKEPQLAAPIILV